MDESSKILPNRAKPLGNYPHLRIANGFVFVSGTSSRRNDNSHRGAIEEDGHWKLDIEEQTHGTIENIGALLKEVGLGLENIVDVTTFLVSMDDFESYNRVYGTYFGPDGPTRTTVAVHQLPHPNLLIEMKVIAKLAG